MSNGYIHHLKHAPKSSILTKILLSAPDLNKVWLLTGEGEMLTASDDVKPAKLGDPGMVTENKHGDIYYKDKAGQLYVDVPLVPCNAMGSLPSDLEEVSMDRPEWGRVRFRVDRIGHGKYYAFEVDGDSMDDGRRDSFERGDVVLVRELDRDDWMPRLYINKWPYWVVCWGNNVRLKQIVAQDEAAGDITLHSLNPSPEYTDFTLSLSEVSRLFNVITKMPKPVEYGI